MVSTGKNIFQIFCPAWTVWCSLTWTYTSSYLYFLLLNTSLVIYLTFLACPLLDSPPPPSQKSLYWVSKNCPWVGYFSLDPHGPPPLYTPLQINVDMHYTCINKYISTYISRLISQFASSTYLSIYRANVNIFTELLFSRSCLPWYLY